ncbi:hypothetical protein CIK05_11025 [Bdellovibrio sp. qaytius]|nr:hypothetical protein CIK05_11025 [Bdellovibrio sp. qaytius]
MKAMKLSIVLLVAFCEVSAYAQTSTATAPATTTTVAAAPVAEAPANTSTATVGATPAASALSINYSNYLNGPALAEPANGMSINHYFTTKYKFKNKWATSFTLRPDTNHQNGEEKTTVMADPYLRVDYPTLYETQDGLKVTGNFNYFVPSSEASKGKKSDGSITTRFIVAKDIAAWSLSYLLIPRLYMWKEKVDGQTIFSQVHYLSASYNLSDFASLDIGVAPEWRQKRNAKTAFNDLPAYPGATFNFTKKLSFSPYVEVPLLKAEQKNSSVGASVSYKLL